MLSCWTMVVDDFECERNTHECSAHASCQNTWGSYSCSCRTGFEGNGRICKGMTYCDNNIRELDELDAYSCLVHYVTIFWKAV